MNQSEWPTLGEGLSPKDPGSELESSTLAEDAHVANLIECRSPKWELPRLPRLALVETEGADPDHVRAQKNKNVFVLNWISKVIRTR